MAYLELKTGELVDLDTGNVVRQRTLTDGREAVEMHYASGCVIELFSSAPDDSEQSSRDQCAEWRDDLKSSLDMIEIPNQRG